MKGTMRLKINICFNKYLKYQRGMHFCFSYYNKPFAILSSKLIATKSGN